MEKLRDNLQKSAVYSNTLADTSSSGYLQKTKKGNDDETQTKDQSDDYILYGHECTISQSGRAKRIRLIFRLLITTWTKLPYALWELSQGE